MTFDHRGGRALDIMRRNGRIFSISIFHFDYFDPSLRNSLFTSFCPICPGSMRAYDLVASSSSFKSRIGSMTGTYEIGRTSRQDLVATTVQHLRRLNWNNLPVHSYPFLTLFDL